MPDSSTSQALRSNKVLTLSIKTIGISLLLLMNFGCSTERTSQVELSIKVTPTDRPGTYTVSGNTNLPDQSQVVVQGIRPLLSPTQLVSASASSNYAILDRQATKSSQGQWQVTLKLWQVAADGQYQEAWQLNQSQINRLQPSPDVVFVAVIDPASQAKSLAKQLEVQGKKLEGANVRFTSDGQWYLQAKQTLAVTLPTGKTTPPGVSTIDVNGGWGNRSELTNTNAGLTQVNLPASKEKQSTAPLASTQRLR